MCVCLDKVLGFNVCVYGRALGWNLFVSQSSCISYCLASFLKFGSTVVQKLSKL